MEKDIGEEIIDKLQEILIEAKERNKRGIEKVEKPSISSKKHDVSNEVSRTLEEINTKLRFMIEEIEYQIKAIEDDKQKY